MHRISRSCARKERAKPGAAARDLRIGKGELQRKNHPGPLDAAYGRSLVTAETMRFLFYFSVIHHEAMARRSGATRDSNEVFHGVFLLYVGACPTMLSVDVLRALAFVRRDWHTRLRHANSSGNSDALIQ
jgi:hypothetical protein